MGPRLLTRWLRQPLLNVSEINQRLDCVELLYKSVTCRNKLIDGPLKALPDIDTIIRK